MCIAAGFHPNSQDRMPRNAWALATAMNRLLEGAPPAEPTEEMCSAGEREVASGRMARYQDWADFCGQIYRAMVKVAPGQAQKGGA